jgi:hypothetical protein
VESQESSPRWTIISRAAGLTIVAAVLVLLFVHIATGRTYDSVSVELLLVIAAWLLGLPSIAEFLKRRPGSG